MYRSVIRTMSWIVCKVKAWVVRRTKGTWCRDRFEVRVIFVDSLVGIEGIHEVGCLKVRVSIALQSKFVVWRI